MSRSVLLASLWVYPYLVGSDLITAKIVRRGMLNTKRLFLCMSARLKLSIIQFTNMWITSEQEIKNNNQQWIRGAVCYTDIR